DTGYQGTDIAFYYDGIADFPTYPLNLLATVNALFGFLTIHPTYPAPNPALGEYTQAEYQAAMADPKNRQTFGGTTFITLPIKNLPILHIPRALAARTGTTFIVEPILDLIEPTLTVLIELGYDRTIPYGQFTTAGLFPIIDPIKLAVDLVGAAAQGVEEAIQDLRSPVQPTDELTQSNPLPFLNLNPFSDPYVNLPAAAPITDAEVVSAAAVEATEAGDSPAPLPADDTAVTDDNNSVPGQTVPGDSGDESATDSDVTRNSKDLRSRPNARSVDRSEAAEAGPSSSDSASSDSKSSDSVSSDSKSSGSKSSGSSDGDDASATGSAAKNSGKGNSSESTSGSED
ncbi:MAG: hypothetical protein K0R68_3679, partial [Mycobacterium sp.]|nr:hypothetical protein [Mycobacterium sp.]